MIIVDLFFVSLALSLSYVAFTMQHDASSWDTGLFVSSDVTEAADPW